MAAIWLTYSAEVKQLCQMWVFGSEHWPTLGAFWFCTEEEVAEVWQLAELPNLKS